MKIKEYLIEKSKDDLIREIINLTKKIPSVHEYYNDLLGESNEVLSKFKSIIEKEYFPSRGFGDARASIIRKAFSKYKVISKSNHDLLELYVYHVEQGVKYTNEYGDIDERFYLSIESSFSLAMKLIKKEKLFKEYQKRCLKIVEDTDGIGWGFHDSLGDMYYSTFEKNNLSARNKNEERPRKK